MGYVSNFKKFIKAEEKKATEIGANPSIEEQSTSDLPTDTTQAQTTPTPATSTQPSTEADPAVISARSALQSATANRDKVIAAKQKELNDLKIAQDALVNTATTNLNKALADAAKKATTPAA